MAGSFDEFVFQKVKEGKGFVVGTGLLSAITGDWFKIRFGNPTGSGVLAYVFRVRGMADTNTSAFMNVRLNTSVLAAAARTPGNLLLGDAIASKIDFRAEASAADFTDGTLSSSVLATPPDQRFELDFFPLVVKPGRAISFSLDSNPAVSNLAMSVYWIEESIP